MNTITKKGQELSVQGTLPTIGEKAPLFNLINRDHNYISLESFIGQKVLISVFPDINTSVCDLQTRFFFNKASAIEDTIILNISNNTIDQFDEWCAVAGIDAEMLSDTNQEFANAYGLWIPEIEHLARSIFVVDKNGTLVYSELVPELAQEPNYDEALRILNTL